MTTLIAIDGPAGTGKSSVSRYLAQHLDFIYVDTGAIYRSLAYLVSKYSVNPDDVDGVLLLIPRIEIMVDKKNHCTRAIIDSQPVGDGLRTEEISRLASIISQHGRVREALLSIQRDLALVIEKGAIFEGRDIGTVVFPKADVKIFITANSETRARRRYNELKSLNKDITYDDILQSIKRRDQRDETRAASPTQRAADAHIIDTSDLTLTEVIDKALSLIKSAIKV